MYDNINLNQYNNDENMNLYIDYLLTKDNIKQYELIEKIGIPKSSFIRAKSIGYTNSKTVYNKIKNYFNIKDLSNEEINDLEELIKLYYKSIYYNNFDLLKEKINNIYNIKNTIFECIYSNIVYLINDIKPISFFIKCDDNILLIKYLSLYKNNLLDINKIEELNVDKRIKPINNLILLEIYKNTNKYNKIYKYSIKCIESISKYYSNYVRDIAYHERIISTYKNNDYINSLEYIIGEIEYSNNYDKYIDYLVISYINTYNYNKALKYINRMSNEKYKYAKLLLDYHLNNELDTYIYDSLYELLLSLILALMNNDNKYNKLTIKMKNNSKIVNIVRNNYDLFYTLIK